MTVPTDTVVTTRPASLVDLLDRLLGAGAVVAGDLTISLAGVDLITVQLRTLIATVREDR